MEKYHLIIFILFITNIGDSQSSFVSQSGYINPKPAHCSAEAALLLLDVQKNLSSDQLLKKHPDVINKEKDIIPALMKVNHEFNKSNLLALEVAINTEIKDIYSIQIPLENYKQVLSLPGIDYIELAKQVYSRVDTAIAESRVNLIHEGHNLSQPYDGAGVIIGICDFGFDYTHPNFRDPETNQLRIVRSWEQNYDRGPKPEGFTYGTELISAEDMLNEKTDITLKGHGTRVAGIAAGSGTPSEGLYKGVAYKSDIVTISAIGFQGIQGLNTGVIDGLSYLKKYAESVNKPAVMNLSLGHHTGPHDGTSLTDQAIDAFSGPGFVVVGAVGNEGDSDGFFLHFNHVFDNENEILNYLVWPEGISSGRTIVDIWGEEGQEFDLSIEIFNPRTKIRESSSQTFSSNSSISISDAFLVDQEGDTLFFSGIIETNPLNNRPHAQFYIDNRNQENNNDVNTNDRLDNDFVQFRFKGTSGEVHAYAANNYGEAFFADLSGIGADELINGVRVMGGNPFYTMGELGGTSKSIISVGAYTSRKQMPNTKGVTWFYLQELGNFYNRSSRGPTHDFRTKPDIMAPGGPIISSENSFYTEFDDDFEAFKISKPEGGHWSYGYRFGTSYSAPVVTGVAALMLQADPTLTPDQIKDLLNSSARMDAFTGALPNEVWGYGKLDAYGAFRNLEQTTGIPQLSDHNNFSIYPNPTNGQFWIKTKGEKLGSITILDASGRRLYQERIETHSKQINLNSLSLTTGVYFIETIQGKKMQVNKLIILN